MRRQSESYCSTTCEFAPARHAHQVSFAAARAHSRESQCEACGVVRCSTERTRRLRKPETSCRSASKSHSANHEQSRHRRLYDTTLQRAQPKHLRAQAARTAGHDTTSLALSGHEPAPPRLHSVSELVEGGANPQWPGRSSGAWPPDIVAMQ